jgi:hypothetical protein
VESKITGSPSKEDGMIGVKLTDKGYKVVINVQEWALTPRELRRAALLHELAHVIRGDCLRTKADVASAPEALLYNVAADAVINRTLPSLQSAPFGVVDPQRVAGAAGLSADGMTANLAYAALKNRIGEVTEANVQDLIKRVCFPADPAAMSARQPQPAESLSDLFPLPVHLRTWVAQRVEWTADSQSLTRDVKGYEGKPGDAAVAHAKETRELKDAAKKDNAEDALPRQPQRGSAGKGAGSAWTPTQTRIVALCDRVREFLNVHGEAVRRRNRSYRRQGRWMLYPSRPYSYEHTFALYVDLSGSTLPHWEVFAGVARWAKAEGARVFTFDDGVREWHPGQKFTAGGGTLWRPVVESAKREQLGAIVVVTDGDFFDRLEDPGIPVLWILTERREMPFGEIVDWSGGYKPPVDYLYVDEKNG